MSVLEELWNESIIRQPIKLNPQAALQARIFADGFTPVEGEFWHVATDGVQYAVQAAETVDGSRPRRMYYATVPNWHDVKWTTDPKDSSLGIEDVADSLPRHATKKYETRPLSAITHLTIHHTVGISTPTNIAHFHVNTRDWPGIAYHWVIWTDGKIYKTNHLTTKSFHAGSYAAPGDENYMSVGIALVGNFMVNKPAQVMLDACRNLVAYLKELLPVDRVYLAHRQMPGASTACCGNTYPLWLPYVTGQGMALHQMAVSTPDMEVCEAAIPDDFLS